LIGGENIYIRGFGSFITKKRAAKIGRNIKKNIAVEIPEHYIPAFKPAKEFVQEVKNKKIDENATPVLNNECQCLLPAILIQNAGLFSEMIFRGRHSCSCN
jgi:hypothetical protein